MSHDPYHLGEAGRAHLTTLLLEAQGRQFEYPVHGGRSWLRWVWRRIRVARRAAALNAKTIVPVSGRTLSIHIEIKY